MFAVLNPEPESPAMFASICHLFVCMRQRWNSPFLLTEITFQKDQKYNRQSCKFNQSPLLRCVFVCVCKEGKAEKLIETDPEDKAEGRATEGK